MVMFAVFAALLFATISDAHAGPVCDFWSKATTNEKKFYLGKVLDGNFKPVYEDTWEAIRSCVHKRAWSAIEDIGKSCSREGDYSAGFVMGFVSETALVICYGEVKSN